MRLSELILSLPIGGETGDDPEIRDVDHDSRNVEPGSLFVAIPGERFDGRRFAPQAVESGAVAILAAGPPLDGAEVQVPWLMTEDPRALLAPLAARIQGHPDRELTMIGVTGTNGKSTTVALTTAILRAAGQRAGSIGTLGYRFDDEHFSSDRTTPEASDLYRILRQMRDAGATAAAMEVSSHALSLSRVAGVSFSVAVFTNLSRDHFDFHRGFEDYFAAKRQLFHQLSRDGRAVVNVEDPYGRRLASELPGALRYGEGGEVVLEEVELTSSGSRGVIATPRGPFRFQCRVLGRYNLSNLLAAVGVAEALEIPHEAIATALAEHPPLPGRMQPVDAGQRFPVLIDYAHTEGALEAALRSARDLGSRRLIVVFGCGGDRDPGKRGPMGRVAGSLADLAILTSDNPRGEDPMAIIAAAEKGLEESGTKTYRIEPDRRKAIRLALELADEDSLVLIAGKGHEQVQIIGNQLYPFSDEEEVILALEERLGTAKDR